MKQRFEINLKLGKEEEGCSRSRVDLLVLVDLKRLRHSLYMLSWSSPLLFQCQLVLQALQQFDACSDIGDLLLLCDPIRHDHHPTASLPG
jgi:hypothetical protein